jgi:hypothetical protein
LGRDAAGGKASLARGTIEPLLELGDEIFEIINLMGEVGSVLALAVERLFGDGLLLLPLIDEHVHAQLLAREQVQIA